MGGWRGCQSSVVSRSGVRVRKSLIAGDDGDLLVKFTVESDREHPVAVRIRDRSTTTEPSDIEAGVCGDETCRWTVDDDRIVLSRSMIPGDSFVTGYRTSHPDRAEAHQTPTIEAAQPIDRQDAVAGVVPQWRGDGGTVSLTNDAGATTGTATDVAPITDDAIDCLVAIPAYNEEGTIADVVSRVDPHADEVVVIDDGSRDDTAARAYEAGATVVQHERNRGYGAALRRTFREADQRGATNLVVIDGDGQHDPDDIPRLLDRQTDRCPRIVIGSRFVGDRKSTIPTYRRFGLSVVNAMTNLSMGTVGSEQRVKDTQSGFRAYNADAIGSLAGNGSIGAGMGASTDVLHHARRHDFDVKEVGTEIEYDVCHASSHNPITHGLALLGNLLRTIERDHPIALLGIPGFTSSFVGLGFGYWMITNYVTTGIFPVGLAVSTSFFLLIGVFACLTAIILHSLNRYFDAGAPAPY
jgi:glycosyltransferase involved in cell wall biosynthesis